VAQAGLVILGGRPRRVRAAALPYLLIAPLVAMIGILALYPTYVTLSQSFYRVDLLDPPVRFVGLQNYAKLLADPAVANAWGNTAWYACFGVTLTVLVGLGMALALRYPFRGRGLVLAFVVLPWALPGVVEGIIWDWIYNPSFGVLNSVLSSLHLISQYQVWISESRIVSIFFISVVQVWQTAPLAALLLLASLQNIPEEIRDAASLDGANRLQELWHVTLPLIRPGLAIAVVQSLIASLNIFDQVYVLNGNAPTGESVVMRTYLTAFGNLNFGQGYALSFLLTILTMGVSIVVLRLIYRKVDF
jgi:multiple sugar transport system permease protein